MKLEKFEEAKAVKETLDKLEHKKYKLESALKSCSLGATIKFNIPGIFTRNNEVDIFNTKIIKDMVAKELEGINEEIDRTKKIFEKL